MKFPKERMVGERGQKKILEKIIEYFPKLVKTTNHRSKKPSKPQASQKKLEKEHQQQKSIAMSFTIRLLEASDKEKVLTYPKQKPHVQTNKHKDVGKFLVQNDTNQKIMKEHL